MTKVRFTFVDIQGNPLPLMEFTLQVKRASFNDEDVGVTLPEQIEVITDQNGQAIVELMPLKTPYRIRISDDYEELCGKLNWQFYVPNVDTIVEAQNLFLVPPPRDIPWDEEALLKIIEAVSDARSSADYAHEQAVDAAHQVDLAAVQVGLAADQVGLASDQVGLATQEVVRAGVEADRARNEADRSLGYANGMQAIADEAQASADEAEAWNVQAELHAVASYTSKEASAVSAAEAAVSANNAAEILESGALPPILDNNTLSTFEGDSIANWENYAFAPVSIVNGKLRVTKGLPIGQSAGSRLPVKLPAGKSDFLVYAKAKIDPNQSTVLWLLSDVYETVGIWCNSLTADPAAANVPNRVCLAAQHSAAQVVMACETVFDFANNELEFALQYEAQYDQVIFWFKGSEGRWEFGARVTCPWLVYRTFAVTFGNNSVEGTICEVSYITTAKPNLIVYGDSISVGANGYSPQYSAGWNNYRSNWAYYADLYQSLRNNLPVIKGFGGLTTPAMEARMPDLLACESRMVFLHASTNDFAGGVTQQQRTDGMQRIIDSLNAAGTQVMLLNAMQGTPESPHNTGGFGPILLKPYVDDWWINWRQKLRGLGQVLDIARVVSLNGYQDPAITELDGVHPTVAGYAKIGARIRQFFGQGYDAIDKLAAKVDDKQPLNTKLTNLAAQVGMANHMLVYSGVDTFAQVDTTPFTQAFMGAPEAVSARGHINAMQNSHAITADGVSDINNMLGPGFQNIVVGPANPNIPTAGGYYYVFNFTFGAENITQLLIPYGYGTGAGVLTWRSRYGGVWAAWHYSVTNAHFTAWALNFVGTASSVTAAQQALQLVPQANSADPTVGRILTVGAFGLGGASVRATDYGHTPQNRKVTGFYSYYLANGAPSAAVNVMESNWGSDSQWMTQLAMGVSNNELYYRSFQPDANPNGPFAHMFSSQNAQTAVSTDQLTTGLMEMGHTSAGTYIKFLNGMLINIVKFTGYTLNEAKHAAWAHPFLTYDNPVVACSIMPTDGWDFYYACYGTYQTAVFVSSQMTSGLNGVCITGIGRWK